MMGGGRAHREETASFSEGIFPHPGTVRSKYLKLSPLAINVQRFNRRKKEQNHCCVGQAYELNAAGRENQRGIPTIDF